MAPAILAALKLLPLIPSALNIFNSKDESSKLEIASQTISLARQAVSSLDLIPKDDPALLAQQIQANPVAKASFKNLVEEREHEWRKLVLQDVQHARQFSGRNHVKLIEDMAAKVMRENVWFVLMLILGQIACMVYFSENGVLLALVSNVIGVVVGQLLGERMQILSYLFGATIVKDKKDEGQSS